MQKEKRRCRFRRFLLIACGLFLLLCACVVIDYRSYLYGAPQRNADNFSEEIFGRIER